jgi:hypothetical protein
MNLKTKPTTTFFEENLKLYFDGLMKVVNEEKKGNIPKTKVLFSENKDTNSFIGTLKTFDAFTTKKMIELNVIIEVSYCKESKQYVPLYKMSPRNYSHVIWGKLKNIKLKEEFCN